MSPSSSLQTAVEKVGKYTKYQREKRGFSLNQFAKRIGITTSFLLRLERGNYQSVSFDVIEKIAKGFDSSIEDFLHKCQITSPQPSLPDIEYFLKEKYQFPKEAISDVKMLISLLKLKYKKPIKELKAKHKEYWEK